MHSSPLHDVAVVGAGIVGATLAVALARAGARVAVVEAREASGGPPDPFEERPIALSAASVRILSTLGFWPEIEPAACPIVRVHVSDRGYPGAARIDALDLDVDALGQVVAASRIAGASSGALRASPDIALACPARVTAIRSFGDRVRLELDAGAGESGIEARLVVAADGTGSAAASMLGIAARESDYAQSAVSAIVSTTRAHRSTAYERFTADGPLALLPMCAGRSGLVWTTTHERAAALAALDDDAFLARLQDMFGTRLGGFVKVGSRATHRLRSVRVRDPVAGRAVAIGNAANTLHPVAGQGLNLGMRDAAVLAERVAAALGAGADPGAPQVLDGYRRARRTDAALVSGATDSLVRLFSNRLPGLGLARGAGLVAFDLAGPVKRAFARRAMGIAGAQARLARGLSP